MKPPVFVVDTNVLVASLVTTASHSPVGCVLDAMLSGQLVYLMSPSLLDGYRAVLSRPRLVKLHGLTESQIDQLLAEVTANAIWREPQTVAPAPDRGDDHLWALLEAYGGSILITGDQLFRANPPPPGSVISPRTWLEDFASELGSDR